MKCPNCPDSTLVMTDRKGVEIDCCPACRGIWLDRGELDKLLDRAATVAAPAATESAPAARDHRQPDFETLTTEGAALPPRTQEVMVERDF